MTKIRVAYEAKGTADLEIGGDGDGVTEEDVYENLVLLVGQELVDGSITWELLEE